MEGQSAIDLERQVRLSQRARWGGGEPIASVLMAHSLANPEVISLAAGFVDQESLPVDITHRAFDAIWSQPQQALSALQYGTTIGYPPLREAILDRAIKADGTPGRVGIDQVVVTAGSNQLLYLVADSILDPGDIVLCGAPSYFVFLGTLANIGARTVGVPVDNDGIIPEGLCEQLERLEKTGDLERVKAIYVTSYFDNPTGATLPQQRRGAIVEAAKRWSRRHPIYLLEDAAYRELRYYGEDIPSLASFDEDGGTVATAGTFSKSFSPGIRVGWGVLPKALIEPALTLKGNIDFGSPNFNQAVMSVVLQEGWFDEHLERLRTTYRSKLDAALAALEEHVVPLGGVEYVRPRGGLYVWLRLPEGIDTGVDGPLFRAAVEEGVLYVPGGYCYPGGNDPAPKNTLRLSFGMPDCETIRRGVEAFGRALRRIRG